MDRKDLIDEIRELEYEQEGADKYKISSLSDEQLILNFIKCTCCDHIPVDEEDIENAIRIAHNAEQFFIVCGFLEELRYGEYGEEGEEDYEEED